MTDHARALHSSASPLWGTSRPLVDLARVVLGRIDLDPFSDPAWNIIVGAKRILTERDDAFACPWFSGAPLGRGILDGGADHAEQWSMSNDEPRPSTALVNPPGDRTGQQVKDAWTLTEWHHRVGFLGGGVVWVAFNLGQFRTTQHVRRSLLHSDFLRCIPSKRIPFVERVQRGKAKREEHPSHDCAIVLLPAHGAAGDVQREVFRVVAGRLGEVF